MSGHDCIINRSEDACLRASEWLIPEYMDEILEEDTKIAVELLNLFFDTVGEIIEKLPVSLRQQDASAACQLLHTLKGSARQMGANDMADFTEAIETRAGQGDLIGMCESIVYLRSMFESLHTNVQSRLNSLERYKTLQPLNVLSDVHIETPSDLRKNLERVQLGSLILPTL